MNDKVLRNISKRLKNIEKQIERVENKDKAIHKITYLQPEETKIQLGFAGLLDANTKNEGSFKSLQEAFETIKTDNDKEELRKSLEMYMINWYQRFDHSWKKIIRINSDSPQSILKRAISFSLSHKLIEENNSYSITQVLEEMARSADETITTYILSILIGASQKLVKDTLEFVSNETINSDRYDIKNSIRKTYNDDNSKHNFPLTGENLDSAVEEMKLRRAHTNGKPLRLYGKKYLIIPIELEETSDDISDTFASDYLNSGLVEKIVVDKLYLGENNRNWYLVEDPMRWEGIAINYTDPTISINTDIKDEIFMSFTVEHSYDGEVIGHEGLFAALN